MRRNLLIAAMAAMAMTFSLSAIAGKEKVVDRSSKKAPEWISTAQEGYLVAAVEAPNIAEAKERAELDIAAQMIRSVARHVSSEVNNVASETVTDGSVDSKDEFTMTTSVRSANLPFLKGISLAKAEDVYWVKLRNKSTGTEHVEYYVKYPFFRQEQQLLVKEFEDYDAERDAELASLEDGYKTVASMEEINTALAKLDALEAYYFDDVRKKKTSGLKNNYKELPKSIMLSGEFISPTELKVEYSLLGHTFNASAPVKASSECASKITVKAVDGAQIVSFDTADCLDDEENFILVTSKMGGKKLSQKFYIPSAHNEN